MNFNQFFEKFEGATSTLAKQAIMEEYLSNQVPALNPFLYWTDSYKISHITFETKGVENIYSNATARFCKYMRELLGEYYDDTFVVFGIQWMMIRFHLMAKNGFFARDKDEVMDEMRDVLTPYIGQDRFKHFEDLHDMQYVPLIVKSIDEGSVMPIGMPFYTCENTVKEFEWLANFLESGMSTDTWKQMTVATIAYAFRKISNQFAMETQGNLDGVDFQNHDFHTRGASGMESGAVAGVAFSLSSLGTDNLPSLWASRHFYFSRNTKERQFQASVPAGEHSVTTLGILTEQRRAEARGEEISLSEAERRYTQWIMKEQFPTGIVSFVADSFDYWNFITEIVPSLYDDIMARDGKFVVRGDSGDPVHIIAGYKILDLDSKDSVRGRFRTIEQLKYNTHLWWENGIEVIKFNGEYYKLNSKFYENGILETINEEKISREEALGTIECLWNIFGGEVNDLGFKHLDSHIGMIYGDGITVHRSVDILTRLRDKGFASTNIVFGVGSYSLNMLSRDHLGIAIKATNAIVDIEGTLTDTPIYKEPKTDMSKKSDRGYLVVLKDDEGNYTKKDLQSRKAMLEIGELTTLYMNGQFHKFTNLGKIQDRLWAEKPEPKEVVEETVV